jgi:hypothetical protein
MTHNEERKIFENIKADISVRLFLGTTGFEPMTLGLQGKMVVFRLYEVL